MKDLNPACQIDVLYGKMTCPVCKDKFLPEDDEHQRSDCIQLADGTVAEICMCPRCWQPLKWTETNFAILTRDQINQVMLELQEAGIDEYDEESLDMGYGDAVEDGQIFSDGIFMGLVEAGRILARACGIKT